MPAGREFLEHHAVAIITPFYIPFDPVHLLHKLCSFVHISSTGQGHRSGQGEARNRSAICVARGLDLLATSDKSVTAYIVTQGMYLGYSAHGGASYFSRLMRLLNPGCWYISAPPIPFDLVDSSGCATIEADKHWFAWCSLSCALASVGIFCVLRCSVILSTR